MTTPKARKRQGQGVTVEEVVAIQPTEFCIGVSEPREVKICHDSIEVIRITDGQTYVVNPPPSPEPDLLEIYWDGVLVYRLKAGTVEVNQMLPALQQYQLAA